MTERRQRMDNDRLVRGMAERPRESSLAAVTRLAWHYHRPPDRPEDDVPVGLAGPGPDAGLSRGQGPREAPE
jgi:hypothetical protein